MTTPSDVIEGVIIAALDAQYAFAAVAAQCIAALDAAGFAIVPKAITQDMVCAMERGHGMAEACIAEAAWPTAISAAPKP